MVQNSLSIHCEDLEPLASYGVNHFIQKYGIQLAFDRDSKINIIYGIDSKTNGFNIYVSKDAGELSSYGKIMVWMGNNESSMPIDGKRKGSPCVVLDGNSIRISFDIFNEVGRILTGFLEHLWGGEENVHEVAKVPIVDYYEKILFDCLLFASRKLNVPLKYKPFWPDGKKFAVCLTHDVDEIRKTYQYFTQAVRGIRVRKLSKVIYQLSSFFTDRILGRNPYWTFEDIMKLEEKLGVRSTFYFLKETAKVNIFKPSTWHHYARKYDFKESEVANIIRKLSSNGWEIGLHGSYESYQDKEKLKYEKAELESVLGKKVSGIRQHHLNLKIPETWEYQEEAGFEYDTSLGFKGGKRIGFRWGTCFPFHPFNNGKMMSILEIPVTIMDISIAPDRNGWKRCLEIIDTVEGYGGVLTLLWHHTVFNEKEHPGMRELYERIINTCREKNAWITNASSIAKWWLKRELDGGVKLVKSGA